LIHRLVLENLKHRPARTLLSALAIGVQVTMILTLVGVSEGMLGDIRERSRGTGADIMVRAPNAAVLGFSGNMVAQIVDVVRKTPHVALATGTLNQSVGNLDFIAGIHLDEFTAMSGGFRYIGKRPDNPFPGGRDLLVDDVMARGRHLHPGSDLDFGGHNWRVTGVVQGGKLSHMFADIGTLQEAYSAVGYVTVVWVKVDGAANVPAVLQSLEKTLPDYKINTVEQYTSLISVDSIPMLQEFIAVVVGVGVVVGFLVVFLSMYMVVLERTREIGILKAMGASPGYILGILLRETVLLAIAGAIAGILMTYGTQQLMSAFAPTMTQRIVPGWWPWATLIALSGALIGALYPGLKAARLDPIEALSYD
jgi:putative ABC transport system permease protein